MIMLQVTLNIVEDVFLHLFFYILMHISLGLVSLGSAEAVIGWNYENLIIFIQVRIENVRDVFLRYSVEWVTN